MIHGPIFIIGSERSGTTLLYNILTTHPDVCWFSAITDRFQSLPEIAFIHRIVDVPVLGPYIKRLILKATKGHHLIISPREGASIYYAHFTNDRRLTERDLVKSKEISFKKIISAHLQMTGKPRFLTKRPMNIQRIRLLNAMFPDAYFIHIIRDGRAAASSFFQTSWWRDHDFWWLGQQKRSGRSTKDPVALCALHWRNTVAEVLCNKALLKTRYKEIRYESFVQDVRGTVAAILNFCNLRQDKQYLESLPMSVPNMNYKWKELLTITQQKILIHTLQKTLIKLGYN